MRVPRQWRGGLRARYFFVFWIVFFAFLPCGWGRLHAVSSIEFCRGIEHDPTEPPGCQKKLVTQLRLDDVRITGAPHNHTVVIKQATDHTLFGEAGSAVVNFSPFSIFLSHSLIEKHYLMGFQRLYPASFTEKVRKDGEWVGSCGPKDDLCGGFTRLDGRSVGRSHGLCCSCLDAVGKNTTGSRLGEGCHNHTVFFGVCLIPHALHYAGYELQKRELSYDVNVSIHAMKGSRENGEPNTETEAEGVWISLNPRMPSRVVEMRFRPDGKREASTPHLSTLTITRVELLERNADLSGFVLFIPETPADHARVRAGVAEWILLPPAAVTVDGRASDKVGVSREAWEEWPRSHCLNGSGEGYRHQLEEFRAADLAARAVGEIPHAMARYLGSFSILPPPASTGRRVAEGSYLVDRADSYGAMRLNWTISADELHYALTASGGVIDHASATPVSGENEEKEKEKKGRKEKKKENETPNPNSAAVLAVVVRNSGVVGSRYTVLAANCTGGVAVDGEGCREFELLPSQTVPVEFSIIRSHPNADVSSSSSLDEAFRQCEVELLGADGVRLAHRILSWSATDEHPPHERSSGGGEGTHGRCHFINLVCVLSGGSFWQVTGWTLIGLGICFVWFLINHFRYGKGSSRSEKEEIEANPPNEVFSTTSSLFYAKGAIHVVSVPELNYSDPGKDSGDALPIASTAQSPYHQSEFEALDDKPSPSSTRPPETRLNHPGDCNNVLHSEVSPNAASPSAVSPRSVRSLK